jgi:23S rRNA (pseudouridine1915-N3)-methyltransferase
VKVHLLFIGKPRDPRANLISQDYVERTNRYARVEMREIRPSRTDLWRTYPHARKILLDPEGRQMSSREFAGLVSRAEMDGRELLFVVGGADGLPGEWRARADLLLSLSRLTLPHEMARVVLAEQIYRAFTTLRGHPYPR